MDVKPIVYKIYFKKNPDFNKESCLELKGKTVDVDQYIPNIKVAHIEVHEDFFYISGFYTGPESSILLWL